MIHIRKGFDLRITGALTTPDRHEALLPGEVGVVLEDFVGVRPNLLIQIGDRVKKGTALFEDRAVPGVYHTAPVSGIVTAIHRGPRRALRSILLRIEGEAALRFPFFDTAALKKLRRDAIQQQLIESGLWVALRTRPFSKTPAVNTSPGAIFVTAIDTQPLAPDPKHAIAAHRETFLIGLELLARLTDGNVYVCQAKGPPLVHSANSRIVIEEFSGPHPAGLVGTHIHYLSPVSERKTVWHVSYQDVIAIGVLFSTGSLYTDRLIAVVGPQVLAPRFLSTTVGASLEALTEANLRGDCNRIISGSVLNGRAACSPTAFLGRFDHQVTVLPEGGEQHLFGWMMPASRTFSLSRTTAGHFRSAESLQVDTSQYGSPRPMLPIGCYDTVMPLDILPAILLRDLLSGDVESAMSMGCLELDEEDLALCSFVCPSKYDYGVALRKVLTEIEQGG